MANFQSQPPSGRQLPNNWASLAKSNAAQADADYQHRTSNAWRGNRDHETLIQSARLSGHPQPAPPRRIDSRSDARFDGTMRLISEDETMQLWRDFNGATVVIKKRK